MQDLESIHLVHVGREEGFSLLVKKYTGKVFRVAMGFVHNKEDAEDITQEVFVKAWQGLPGFDERSAFTTWLYRITIHESLNFLKKKKRRMAWEKLRTIFSGDPIAPASSDNLEQEEEFRYIITALDSLSDKQKQAFVLTEYEDMTQREVASVMGISEGAVEQLLLRARASLRKKWKNSSPHP